LFGKHERKRPFGRRRPRLRGYINVDLKEMGWEGVDLIHLNQDGDKWAVVNTVMNLRLYETLGISSLFVDMLASEEGLCCVQLVNELNSHHSIKSYCRTS
jgi:hypothetical protein